MIIDIVLKDNGSTVVPVVASRAVKENGKVEVLRGNSSEDMTEFDLNASGISVDSKTTEKATFTVSQQPTTVSAAYDSQNLATPVIDMDASNGLDSSVMALVSAPSAPGGYILSSQFKQTLANNTDTTTIHFHLESPASYLNGGGYVTVSFSKSGGNYDAPDPITLNATTTDLDVTFPTGKFHILAAFTPGTAFMAEIEASYKIPHLQVGGGEEGDVDIEPWP